MYGTYEPKGEGCVYQYHKETGKLLTVTFRPQSCRDIFEQFQIRERCLRRAGARTKLCATGHRIGSVWREVMIVTLHKTRAGLTSSSI